MKSFIVRVYPAAGRGVTDACMTGIVEDPESGRQQTFHDARELWSTIGQMVAADSERGQDTSRAKRPAG